MNKISYTGYRFPPEIIHQAIWLYLRFTLSLRDVEDLLAERGVAVSYETVRRWVNHFGPMIAADLRKRRLKPHTTGGYGEPHVTVSGTAAAYSLTLDGAYATTLTLSGTLTLGTSLTADDYATLALSGGTLSAQSISSNNAGYLSGYGTVGGAVSGGVSMTAVGGALQVEGSLAEIKALSPSTEAPVSS